VSRFTQAIVRPPAATFAAGITTSGLGAPDLALALAQHDGYCRALERFGVALVRLAPDPEHPDSTFIEDVAVLTRRGALLTRPGAASRAGEVTAIEPVLRDRFPNLGEITAPGTLDAGDVCEAGEHFLVGISRRTNPEGAAQLTQWLAQRCFSASTIDIRAIPGLLHLKSGLSWLGGRRLLAVGGLAGHAALREWEIVRVPGGEDYAANCVQVNGALLVAEGFPATSALLDGLGYDLVPVAMSEYQKMDGALSCLSLRW
jgi:dimethylargininase